MMPPNKSKKAAVAIGELSPEAGSPVSKHPQSKLNEETGEDTPSRTSGSLGSAVRNANFSGQKKPAELFRKDLISAMKLADKDTLADKSYFLISDPWRQEWEKGVQVPVNATDVKEASVKEISKKSKTGDFKMPHKLLHERADETYRKGQHELTGMSELTEQLVRYDLDDLDVSWLEELNFKLREMGLTEINEWGVERIIETLETQCHEKMMDVMKTEEGLGIEYDDNVVCDICQCPDGEESNEMIFCDGCDVCVHQECYGVSTIPEGSWLCRPCAVGIKPQCMLCPKAGGAMKCTRSGTKWVHVSCALWIPEVKFGDPVKMEPVVKISHIPPGRWSLLCCVCKDRFGACVQCTEQSCKTAFHVTCAFTEDLQMKISDADEEGNFIFKPYCPKHSKKKESSKPESDLGTPRKVSQSLSSTPQKQGPSECGSPRKRGLSECGSLRRQDSSGCASSRKRGPSECRSPLRKGPAECATPQKQSLKAESTTPCKKTTQKETPCKGSPRKGGQRKGSPCKGSPRKDSPSSPEKPLTQKERASQRAKKLKKLEEEFYNLVDIPTVCQSLQIKEEVVDMVYVYWKLKRKCNFDRPLLTPKKEEADVLEKQEEDSRLARMKMFIHLRHDLERVRNLCYMISKREKMKRQFYVNKDQVFKAMVRVLRNKSFRLSNTDVKSIVHNYSFDSIYNDYGLSVQRLPGELSEEDEMDEKSAMKAEESNVPVKVKKHTARTSTVDKTPQESRESKRKTAPDKDFNAKNKTKSRKRWGGKAQNAAEVENIGVKKKRSHLHQSEASSPAVSLEPRMNSGTNSSEETFLIASSQESEVDAESPDRTENIHSQSEQTGNKFSSAQSSSSPSKSVEKCLRGKQRKGRRGRKPWYVRKEEFRDSVLTSESFCTDDDLSSLQDENSLVDVESVDSHLAEDMPHKFSRALPGLRLKDISRKSSWRGASDIESDLSEVEESLKVKSEWTDTKASIKAEIAFSDMGKNLASATVKSGSGLGDDAVQVTRRRMKLSSFMPTRSNRKHTLPELKLSDVETSKSSSEFCQPVENIEISSQKTIQSLADADDTFPTPSKVRKLGRYQTRGKTVNAENLKTVTRNVQPKDVPYSDFESEGSNISVVSSSQKKSPAKNTDADIEQAGSDCAHSEIIKNSMRKLDEVVKTSETSQKLHDKGIYGAGEDIVEMEPLRRQRRKRGCQARFVSSTDSIKSDVIEEKVKPSKLDVSLFSFPENGLKGFNIKSSNNISAVSNKERSDEGNTVGKGQISADVGSCQSQQSPEEKEKACGSNSGCVKSEKMKAMLSIQSLSSDSTNKSGVVKKRGRPRKHAFTANGIVDTSQRKINAFFKTVTGQGSELRENVSIVTRSSSPRKKLKTDIKMEVPDDSQRNGCGMQFPADESSNHSRKNCLLFESDVVSVSSHSHGNEGVVSPKKTETAPAGSSELEAVTALSKGECEADQFNEDNFRGFRSQSPSSEASTTTALCIDSRESTPRPFTRSRVVSDNSTENIAFSGSQVNSKNFLSKRRIL